MTDREKVWRGDRPKSGVSILAHTRERFQTSTKKIVKEVYFKLAYAKQRTGNCALYLIIHTYIYIYIYILPTQGVYFNPLD